MILWHNQVRYHKESQILLDLTGSINLICATSCLLNPAEVPIRINYQLQNMPKSCS